MIGDVRASLLGSVGGRLAAVAIFMLLATLVALPIEAKPDERSKSTTELFDAVQANDFAAVQASVSAGADLTARNAWDLSPAEVAVDRGHYRIAHFLVSVRNLTAQKPASATPAPRATAASVPASATAAAALRAAVPQPNGQVTQHGKTTTARSAQRTDAPEQAVRVSTSPGRSDRPSPFDPSMPAYGAMIGPVDPGDPAATASVVR